MLHIWHVYNVQHIYTLEWAHFLYLGDAGGDWYTVGEILEKGKNRFLDASGLFYLLVCLF